MPLPTPLELAGLDYAFQGQPFAEVPATATITLRTLDYAFQGEPFARNEWPEASAFDSLAIKLIARGVI